MTRFEIDNNKGELTYTLRTESSGKTRIVRTSGYTEGDDLLTVTELHDTEDSAKQRLWTMKERNSQRIDATVRKLDMERREQAALNEAIGDWVPPVIEDPEDPIAEPKL